MNGGMNLSEFDVAALLPKFIDVPQHLRSHKDYKVWLSTKLKDHYPEEYRWLYQHGGGTRDMLYDLLDDFFPEEFKLEQRQIRREGWRYAAEFAIIVMEVIQDNDLTDTSFIIQHDSEGANLVLVRPVLGELVGTPPYQLGRRK